ncbi:MAG: radical SAM family heme chaperone HemW [Bdellovibrionales bacterium]|nr:radical SAM family heme chaperone HemW [Bdellovibrionales bacterium]
MSFGVYVHIPYCVQICPYCDFTKYELGKTLEPSSYIDLVQKEILHRGPAIGPRPLDSIYFGGGTPSLIEPEFILTVIRTLSTAGFKLKPDAEITIEANPGTLPQSALESLMKGGINRLSVGAQTFDPEHLKALGRKHSVEETLATLKMIRAAEVNYSFDLMFALPKQTLVQLESDIAQVLEWSPPHVSLYCLTVPSGNPLAKNRPTDDAQHEMFQHILTRLEGAGYERYEVSNFAKPGFRSKHNQLYWQDSPYWGIGVSSHSYMDHGPWGTRFWNAPQMESYRTQILKEENRPIPETGRLEEIFSLLPPSQVEILKQEEAATDYCHTALRKADGLHWAAVHRKFGALVADEFQKRLKDQKLEGLLEWHDQGCYLSRKGWVLADRVFESLTFLPGELTFEHPKS